MRSDCQLTCDFCSPPKTCVDSNTQCPRWKRRGECCNSPKYMLGNCRKSCGVCTETAPIAQWEEWSSFRPCTKSCGKGITYRTRVCDGDSCPGQSKEYKYCNTKPCQVAPRPSSRCGTGHIAPISSRIVGGTNAGIWPWQVGLTTRINSRSPICGGTLVSSRIVLTAAHCFDKYSSLYVRVGDHDLYTKEQNQVRITYTWCPKKTMFYPDKSNLIYLE